MYLVRVQHCSRTELVDMGVGSLLGVHGVHGGLDRRTEPWKGEESPWAAALGAKGGQRGCWSMCRRFERLAVNMCSTYTAVRTASPSPSPLLRPLTASSALAYLGRYLLFFFFFFFQEKGYGIIGDLFFAGRPLLKASTDVQFVLLSAYRYLRSAWKEPCMLQAGTNRDHRKLPNPQQSP